jgi:transcriptional regulator with XRE-family HTH domain
VSKKNYENILTHSCVKFIFLKKNDTMKNLNAVRINLGLSQLEMASYLQIHRSQLTMYEQGKRDLPTHALVKLAEMELFLYNYTSQPSPSFPLEAEQLQKATEIFEKHQKEVAYRQLILQQKLEVLQTNYQYNIRLLAFLTEMQEKNADANGLEKNWIAVMKTNALLKIEANGLHHQTKIKLQMEMNILCNKTDFINNLIAFLSNS